MEDFFDTLAFLIHSPNTQDSNTENKVSFDSKRPLRALVGAEGYRAPEMLRAKKGECGYGMEVDWWALGLFLYECMVGQNPFRESVSVLNIGGLPAADMNVLLFFFFFYL